MMIGFLMAAALQIAPACHAIKEDRIYARDLAAVEPAFQALPPRLELGLSPVPGQQRVFRVEELTKIARINHIEGAFANPVCFGWEMALPSQTDLLAAMNKALGNRNSTSIEIIDQSNTPLPKGDLVFPLSGLSGSSDRPVVWRGALNYGNGRTLLTWARVRITVKEQYVASAEPLRPGEEIRAEQLKLVDYQGPITRERHFTSIKELVGMTPRSTVISDSLLTDAVLRERKEVERGDLVQVIVQIERTRIETQGVAEDGGARGSVVMVRNAKSGRKFRARVEDKGKVLVLPGGLTGLAIEGDSKS